MCDLGFLLNSLCREDPDVKSRGSFQEQSLPWWTGAFLGNVEAESRRYSHSVLIAGRGKLFDLFSAHDDTVLPNKRQINIIESLEPIVPDT